MNTLAASVQATYLHDTRLHIRHCAYGYEDGTGLGRLRTDPSRSLAVSEPDKGWVLYSQPTLRRLENESDLREMIRLSYVLADL